MTERHGFIRASIFTHISSNMRSADKVTHRYSQNSPLAWSQAMARWWCYDIDIQYWRWRPPADIQHHAGNFNYPGPFTAAANQARCRCFGKPSILTSEPCPFSCRN
jgi:hypothetical protein